MKTLDELVSEKIKALNPKWNYGRDDEEIFRSLWFYFDPMVARRILKSAMFEYADQQMEQLRRENERLRKYLKLVLDGNRLDINYVNVAREARKLIES